MTDSDQRAIRSGVTPAELLALRTYVQTGSLRETAEQLQLAEQIVKNQLATARQRLGAPNTEQALHKLGLR